jgi:signal transduction histidine kinase
VSDNDLRTVIYTPTGKDGDLIAGLLERLQKPCHVAHNMEEACRLLTEGAGAAILAEEAFAIDSIAPLAKVMQQQPSWSDLPLILLTVGGRVTLESERLREFRRPLGNILLLERPIRPETLISTLDNALRARRRQYQIREQMLQYARAQEALLRSEKLAVTGRLAASIAHEINNPLEAITNLLYLMRGSTKEPERSELLAEAEQELARVTEIAKQTLRFYRETAQPAPTDVTEVVESVLKLYGSRLRAAKVTVETEPLSESPVVLSTPGELRQVVANLVGNAVDAMRSGGRLRIRTSLQRERIRLTIADTGAGIPAEVLPTIFEPFVTTKGETGTGLGLWVTAEIMKKNGWSIRVRSCRGARCSGTVFSIVMPVLGAEQTTRGGGSSS